MRQVESDRPSQVVADADTVFPAKLVGRHAGGIGLECQVDQFKHRLQVDLRVFRRDVELQVIDVDLGERDVHPPLGFFDLDLGVPNRLEILVQRFLVTAGECSPQGTGIGQQVVERTLTEREPTCRIAVALDEQHVEDLFRPVLGGNGAATPVERQGVGTSRSSRAAVGRQDQRRKAGLISDVSGKFLVQRDRVPVSASGSGCRSGEELVGIGMAVDAPDRGM